MIQTTSSREKIQKKSVSKDEPQWYIRIGETVFKIQYTQLMNKLIDNEQEVIQASEEKGYSPRSDLRRYCLGCDFNENNALAIVTGSTKEYGVQCTYKGEENIAIARPFEEKKTKRIFMAVQEPCAFYDALTITLANNGSLDDCISKEEFDFRPINDFTQKKANTKEYEIKRPSILARIKEYIRR